MYAWPAGLVLLVFVVHPGINGYERAMFGDMVYGRAHKPFVTRTLLPSAVRVVTQATPLRIRDSAAARLAGNRLVRTLGWERRYLFEYAVAALLMLLCLVGFAFTLRQLVRTFYDCSHLAADTVPVFALAALPLMFCYQNYVYDPATLLLFTLGIVLIIQKRLALFYPLLVLATLNKETAVLLILVFAIAQWRRGPLVRYSGHLLAMGAVWLAVRAFLAWVYQANPGELVEFHLVDHNLRLTRMPTRLLHFLGVLALYAWLIGRDWHQKSAFLRDGLLVTFVPLFGLALLLGYCDEMRGYYEAFPFAFLLALPTAIRLLSGSRLATRAIN